MEELVLTTLGDELDLEEGMEETVSKTTCGFLSERLEN